MNSIVKRANIGRYVPLLLVLSMLPLTIAGAIGQPQPPPLGIKLSPLSAALNVGETKIFNATALDDKNNTIPGIKITFTSSNTTVGTVAPSSALTGPDGNASVTFTAIKAGDAFVNATNASASVNGSAIVTVKPQPFDFNISISPSSGTVEQGKSTSATVTATLLSGTTQAVSLTATGLPSGATASFIPSSGNPTFSSNMTITTAPTTPTGTYTVTITGTGGGKTRTATYTLTVTPHTAVFDTGSGTYPSISGTHTGTITPNSDVTVSKMYTYPCAGTGGHSEYVWIYGNGVNVSASWAGYGGDWHNITFPTNFTLKAWKTYNYTLRTGSYPQIIHATSKAVTGGTITCKQFTDANGKAYTDWIPAVRLE